VTARNRVTDTDRGLARVAARLRPFRVRVGILSDAPKDAQDGEASGQTLLEVAAVHEFGAPAAGIPQRSFIRGTVDEKEGEIVAAQAALARRIVQGKVDGPTAGAQLGAKVKGFVQQRIAQGIEPALAPETVERKGSSKQLVDTGQLRSSITFVVEEG